VSPDCVNYPEPQSQSQNRLTTALVHKRRFLYLFPPSPMMSSAALSNHSDTLRIGSLVLSVVISSFHFCASWGQSEPCSFKSDDLVSGSYLRRNNVKWREKRLQMGHRKCRGHNFSLTPVNFPWKRCSGMNVIKFIKDVPSVEPILSPVSIRRECDVSGLFGKL
jgi:hypothetical protein